MELEYLKQKIMNHVEIKKYLSTYILVLTGGIISLFFSDFSYAKMVLLIVGCVVGIALINGATKQNDLIEQLLLKLKEDA
jgi:intracellular septation protein A